MWEAITGVLGAMVIGLVGWAVHVSNDVAVLKSENEGLQRLMETRFDALEQRLERIESKIDHDNKW